MVSGSDDATIKLWDTPDVSDIDPLTEIATLKGKITSVTISPDGSKLAATANNGNACVWNLTNIQKPKPIRAFDKLDAPQALRWSPDGSLYAIAQKNGIITIITNDSNIQHQQEHAAETRALGWHGNVLITGSSTGRIQIKNTSTLTKDLEEEQSGN